MTTSPDSAGRRADPVAGAVRAGDGGARPGAELGPARRPRDHPGRRHPRGLRRRALRGRLGADGRARTRSTRARASCSGCCPDGDDVFPEAPGASIVVNPCLSGGAMEIYLEPLLPSPVLHLVGSSPTAEAVADLAPALGFVVERAAEGADPAGATVAIVATPRRDEAGPVRAALDAGVGFVGVVCSHTRASLAAGRARRCHRGERPACTPTSGVEIGARTAPEIALSIMAAVVRGIRVEGLAAVPPGAARRRPGRRRPIDPVCGMTVTIGAGHPARGGRRHGVLVLPPGLPVQLPARRTRRERGRPLSWPPADRDAWARPSSCSPSVARRCSTPPCPRPGRRRSTRWSWRSAGPRSRCRSGST